MMRLLTGLAALFLATQVWAQDSPNLDAARTYVESKGQQALLNDMLSPEGVMAQMGLVEGRIPDGKKETLATIVSEELDAIRPMLEEAMIEGMAETFTLGEIEALTEFYSSDEGASAMTKMNPYMAQTMQRVGPAFQEMQGRLTQRIQAEMTP